MSFSLYSPVAFLVITVGVVVVNDFLKSSRTRYPPGPNGLPIIGNLLQIPSVAPENRFREWKNQYGNIIMVTVFRQPMIILSSIQAARDLFEKRSSIYSDRPRFVLFSELMGWQHASTHIRYGPRFRKHRRFMNQRFNQRAIQNYAPLQEKETLVLLDGMLKNPSALNDHLKRYAAATILKITYGYDIHSVDDLFVKLADRAGTLTIQSGSPAATLVDFFPALRHIPTWVPYISIKAKTLEAKKAVDDMFNIPFERVKADVKSGKANGSYTSHLLESHKYGDDGLIDQEDEDDIKGSAGTLFAAAEDTTIAVMEFFVLAMVRNPRVYKKLQAEMDSVLGGQRLPAMHDMQSLPYLRCVLKEVLRWSPPVPLGMPHRVMEDDYYQDYMIPAGSTLLVNIDSILRDCPNPDEFIPERYLKNPDLPDPFTLVFGFGRRICPGRHFAESSMWYIAANMIATLNISKAVDDRGLKITPPLEYLPGFVRHVKPFEFTIRPKSGNTAVLMFHAKELQSSRYGN